MENDGCRKGSYMVLYNDFYNQNNNYMCEADALFVARSCQAGEGGVGDRGDQRKLGVKRVATLQKAGCGNSKLLGTNR